MTLKNEETINLLVKIRKELNDVIDKNYAIIEELRADNDCLKLRVREIDKYISINSIISAEILYDTETFLEKKANHKFENIDFTRKIFSLEDQETLLIRFKYDGKTIKISFPNPNITQITPVCNVYLNSIITPLMALKENEDDMEIKISNQNDDGNITKMEIQNIYSFENVDLIFKIFNNLISEQR